MPSALAATAQWPCRLHSAWTQPKNSYFKFLQGSVATLFRWSWKILSYFVANLSKTLLINFYQNRSSIVEVMIKKFWCVFLCLTVYLVSVSIFLYSFVSISQVIGCEDRLRNDLYCVRWGDKLCSLTHILIGWMWLLLSCREHST